MARDRKTVQTEEVKNVNPEVDNENASLREQVEQLQAMVKALLSQKDSSASVQSKEDETESDIEESDTIAINNDEYIKIMSLCPYALNLTTQPRGQGKIFKFKEFGEVKRILYRDLVEVIESHQSFVEQGLFYILNKNVIRRHGLDDTYKNILTKDKIESIFSGNVNNAVALFKSATNAQKQFIVEILIAKVRDGEEVDFNIVTNLSRASGKDILAEASLAQQYSKENLDDE